MKNPGRSLPYKIAWLISHQVTSLVYRCETYGEENVPTKGGFLLACNHASFFDPPAIGGNCPRELHFFARKTLFVGRFGDLIRSLNSIPIDRDGDSDFAAFKQVFRTLKEGGGLLVFPEGTRTHDGKLQAGRKGVGLIACKAGVPVVPARIFGSFEAYSRHTKIPDWKPQMKICYGPPLLPKDYDPDSKNKDRYQIAADIIMERIARLHPPKIGGI